MPDTQVEIKERLKFLKGPTRPLSLTEWQSCLDAALDTIMPCLADLDGFKPLREYFSDFGVAMPMHDYECYPVYRDNRFPRIFLTHDGNLLIFVHAAEVDLASEAKHLCETMHYHHLGSAREYVPRIIESLDRLLGRAVGHQLRKMEQLRKISDDISWERGAMPPTSM